MKEILGVISGLNETLVSVFANQALEQSKTYNEAIERINSFQWESTSDEQKMFLKRATDHVKSVALSKPIK